MPPTYEYRCKNCGVEVEYDRILTDETRHIDAKGKVCGTLRRVWSANINLANCRAVPRGGR